MAGRGSAPARRAGGKPGAEAKPARSGGAGAWLWWAGLACGGLMALSPGIVLLVGVLEAPILLVVLSTYMAPGKKSQNEAGRTVHAAMLFGAAAAIRPLHRLLLAGASLSTASEMAQEPVTLFGCWLAIGAGWLGGEVLAISIRFASELSAASQRRVLTQRLEVLEAEWGPLPQQEGEAKRK